MPFLKAGFNARNTKTGIFGWTRHARGNRRGFAVAELRRFVCGDYFWLGIGQRFLTWGECVVIGSRPEFYLPIRFQYGLAQCDVATRAERPDEHGWRFTA